ncbi:unnamed protein product [Musa acuminata subsp. malaccensis]|uniref:(wild Malaysian banana) hypothetical protein n=1 Tax=Musa acuminata subsp. malaccensis TaxID=214687 RepID=A0A804IUE4_MUSAM|nr:PREDICTED: calmodulin-binding protein 60 C isoform X1 [Musa acuminata subsp. malaccensis]CAG1843526.1 unnamed protein product [Musa acuminata subsp. malaccensis]
MTRDKRGLGSDTSEKDDLHPENKRLKVPALARVIIEALQMDGLQRICSSLEPIIRIVVSEEVERALAKLGAVRNGERCLPKQIEGPDGRNLQLHFTTRLSLPIITGGEIEGEDGAIIHIVLVDANTGCVVNSGPEASAKLDVLVLDGDFNFEDNDNWTEDEFKRHIVKERKGKRPLLTGDLQVSLKEGVGTLGKLNFTDNSCWIRSRTFRLALKIAAGCCKGTRVREAKTEAFMVKERRGQLHKKHHPPALGDEIWRLENIAKDGSFHNKLNTSGIRTVEDFLKFVARDAQGLRDMLGSSMSDKMWRKLVEHANTSVLGGKYHVCYLDETRNVGAVFNDRYVFCGLIDGGQFKSTECLIDGRQKDLADKLVKKAYDNWAAVIIYDGKDLLKVTESETASASQKEPLLPSADCSSSYDLQVSQIPNPEQCPVIRDAVAEGVSTEDNTGLQPFNQTEQRPDASINHDWPQPDAHSTDDFPDFIRSISQPLFEDIFHSLDDICTGGASTSLHGGFDFSSCTPLWSPEFNLDHYQNSTSGRAVGWLKITKIAAAIRWALFIRKKAADRRKAKLVELEQ